MPGRKDNADRTARATHRPSARVRAVLEAAASSPELLDMLVKNRAQAMARMGLSEEEKAVVMSLSTERLVKMVRRDGQGASPWGALRSRMLLFGGLLIALLVFKLIASDAAESRARLALVRIRVAQETYRLEHSTYGSLDDLVRNGVLDRAWFVSEIESNEDYEFRIVLEHDTFAAAANPTMRPDLPGFRAGPEGEIKVLE